MFKAQGSGCGFFQGCIWGLGRKAKVQKEMTRLLLLKLSLCSSCWDGMDIVLCLSEGLGFRGLGFRGLGFRGDLMQRTSPGWFGLGKLECFRNLT